MGGFHGEIIDECLPDLQSNSAADGEDYQEWIHWILLNVIHFQVSNEAVGKRPSAALPLSLVTVAYK
jgi:hypothetical protein